ncbi:MAG: 23S rRNA (pseudouridine(1915)-N(3))-methyltransferase RlmH [Bacteroidetes bacterium]|nr:23S rRNA (pseudouridine(1915)-N(3))-methyltransferase RlmH [Bacteroidota bacterium]
MKIRIIAIGKTDSGWLKEGLTTYLERVKRYLKIEWLEIELNSNTKKGKVEVMILEAGKILACIKSSDYVVLLDEKGKQYRSEEFAAWLNKKFISVQEDIVFVIGGPYGFHDSVKARSSEQLSLSEMTYTHQMIRLFFTEQLYRAMTILKNEPYHHS